MGTSSRARGSLAQGAQRCGVWGAVITLWTEVACVNARGGRAMRSFEAEAGDPVLRVRRAACPSRPEDQAPLDRGVAVDHAEQLIVAGTLLVGHASVRHRLV